MIIREITMLISNIHNKTPKMVSYLQIYAWKISSTELILWSIKLNFVSKNYLRTKIESKRKYKWLPAKRSEGAEGVLAEPREDPSASIIVSNAYNPQKWWIFSMHLLEIGASFTRILWSFLSKKNHTIYTCYSSFQEHQPHHPTAQYVNHCCLQTSGIHC